MTRRGRIGKNDIEIVIEKGIPIPPILSPLAQRVSAMEVGDSFVFVRPSTNVRQRIRSAFKAAGYTYDVRDGFGGEVRYWRVA